MALFRATCATCHRRFSAPILSDFDYGEFLLHGEHGKAVAFLPALLEPAWKVIAALCPGPHMTPQGYPNNGRLHWVIAQLADPVEDERFQMEIACPDCSSTAATFDMGTRVGFMDIPAASYRGFLSLSPDEQKAAVLALSDAYIRDRGR